MKQNSIISIFIHRNNPDNNFLYSKAVNASAEDGELHRIYFESWKANIVFATAFNKDAFLIAEKKLQCI